MSVSAPEQQEVRNYKDILDTVSEWPPSARAALIRDVAETMVERTKVDAWENRTAEETSAVVELRQMWERKRRARANLTPARHTYTPPEPGTEEEVQERLRQMWEENRRRAHENFVPRPKRNTLQEAYGIGNAEHPGPSDEEVEQWLHERRMERYG